MRTPEFVELKCNGSRIALRPDAIRAVHETNSEDHPVTPSEVGAIVVTDAGDHGEMQSLGVEHTYNEVMRMIESATDLVALRPSNG